jgi:hypothetical protein
MINASIEHTEPRKISLWILPNCKKQSLRLLASTPIAWAQKPRSHLWIELVLRNNGQEFVLAPLYLRFLDSPWQNDLSVAENCSLVSIDFKDLS